MSPGESTHQGESELPDFLRRIQAGDEGAARELLGRFEAEVRLVVRRQLPRLLRRGSIPWTSSRASGAASSVGCARPRRNSKTRDTLSHSWRGPRRIR